LYIKLIKGSFIMKETTDLVCAVISLANGVGKAAADDEKIDITDTIYLMDFMAALPAAATGAELIPKEIATMTPPERKSLMELVRKKFDIPQDDIEGIIEDAISVAEDLVCLFSRVKKVING